MRIETVHYFCFNDVSQLKATDLTEEQRLDFKFGDNNDAFRFRVFPNPTSARFNLEIAEPVEKVSVEIFNLLGNRIASWELSGSDIYELDMQSQPNGIYFIRISDGTSYRIEKLIKN